MVRAALPADDIAILTLQVNFFGTLDFKTGRLQFDASLYDSHILGYTLTGDMAFRFYWLDDANLLLTAGGFNPAYTPPPMNLPQLSRISIVLFEGNPDVRAEGYFAVTSNTVQFGARIELNYGVHGFSVSGFLSLDAVVTLHSVPLHVGRGRDAGGSQRQRHVVLDQARADPRRAAALARPWHRVLRDRLRLHHHDQRVLRHHRRPFAGHAAGADRRAR